MKIVFLVGSVNISGGTYVIFEHASNLQNMGHDIFILTEEKVFDKDVSWHTSGRVLTYINYEDLNKYSFDIAIATWWKTVFRLDEVDTNKYIYFVQSIESKFYIEEEKALRHLVESTYTLDLSIITEATWIKEYLETNYLCNVSLVLNGIRKDIYNTDVVAKAKKLEKGLRVLVEGPLGVSFKNVEKTITLCKESLANEIWLMTSSPIKNYKGVDRVYSQVAIIEAAEVYASCDVVVKLSYVEGMFGPPLEIFHCGGTAIVYDVTGYDEYIIDNVNALVIQTDDEQAVIQAINSLVENSDKLLQLKKNASCTANKWLGWKESSIAFEKAIIHNSKSLLSRERLKILTQFHEMSYIISETSLRKKNILEKILEFKIHLKNRYPNLYQWIKKLYYKFFRKPFPQ